MNLAVLGERVFVRPEARPEFTESGLSLVHDRGGCTIKGVVVALGDGPKARKAAVAKALAPLIKHMREVEELYLPSVTLAIVIAFRVEAERIVARYNGDHLVSLGDRVIFSADAGEELVFANEVIIAMRETDILAVIDEETAE